MITPAKVGRFNPALRAPRKRGSGAQPTARLGRVMRRAGFGPDQSSRHIRTDCRPRALRLPQPNRARLRTFGVEPTRRPACATLISDRADEEKGART